MPTRRCGVTRRLFFAVLFLGVTAAGCSQSRPLPVARSPQLCRGVGVDAALTGDASDARVTWLVFTSGHEIPLVWPPGWAARFAPSLEVLDPGGTVRLRAGDAVSGVCQKGPVDAPGSLMMIEGL